MKKSFLLLVFALAGCQKPSWFFPYATTKGDSPNGILLFTHLLKSKGFEVSESFRANPEDMKDVYIWFDPMQIGFQEEDFDAWIETLAPYENHLLIVVGNTYRNEKSFWFDQVQTFPEGRSLEDLPEGLPDILAGPDLYPFIYEGDTQRAVLDQDQADGDTGIELAVPGALHYEEPYWELAWTEAGSYACYIGTAYDDEDRDTESGILYFSSSELFLNYSMIHPDRYALLEDLLTPYLHGKTAQIIQWPNLSPAQPPEEDILGLIRVFPLNWMALQFFLLMLFFFWGKSLIIGYGPLQKRAESLSFSDHVRALGRRLAQTGHYQRAYFLVHHFLHQAPKHQVASEQEAIEKIQKLLER
ncbi:MAG: hypothetical protein H6510_02670 [Acidobacteria bacterium]|nr:hypothetical protein [Acidobacteriota bacterium]MCB9396699.1 hypothetical protein [Acidobacteriota bacterium]